jgi:hypothetical protein
VSAHSWLGGWPGTCAVVLSIPPGIALILMVLILMVDWHVLMTRTKVLLL